jgi:hypothetical protein
MKLKIHSIYTIVLFVSLIAGCRDESTYPLPFDDRTTGHYLRVYSISSNIWNREDLNNSAFEAVYESIDADKGRLLDSVSFYASFRRTGVGLTREVLVKRVAASEFNFSFVEEPTYSEYLRSEPFRVTATEVRNALQSLASTDPDGTGALVAYPADGGLFGDVFTIRWRARTKDGQSYTVFNPQTTVNPAFGNLAEANMTPNVTRGQFYNAPYIITFTVSQTVTTAVTDATPYTGTYSMSQVAIWSPNHSVGLHLQGMPGNILKPFVFGSSGTDSTQTVTLTTVPGGLGLPSEREFTCTYRGQQVTIRISLEAGLTNGVNADALATLTTATNANVPPGTHTSRGLGFPAGTTTTNLGAVHVNLFNTGVACAGNSEREFYQVTPVAGVFNPLATANPVTGAAISPSSSIALPWGAPRSAYPNRGVYRIDLDGKVAGQVFTIGIDDDADEYGRRNGYCNWYRRIYLRLEKLP